MPQIPNHLTKSPSSRMEGFQKTSRPLFTMVILGTGSILTMETIHEFLIYLFVHFFILLFFFNFQFWKPTQQSCQVNPLLENFKYTKKQLLQLLPYLPTWLLQVEAAQVRIIKIDLCFYMYYFIIFLVFVSASSIRKSSSLTSSSSAILTASNNILTG